MTQARNTDPATASYLESLKVQHDDDDEDQHGVDQTNNNKVAVKFDTHCKIIL